MPSVATGGADPVGGSQSLRKIFRATGGGRRAKKVQFKRGINPLFYFQERRCLVARDGTYRGGRRVKAGSKPEALVDKIVAGKEANVLETHDFDPEALFAPDEPEGISDLYGEDMPEPSDYLSARQKDGKPLGADEIYEETWLWLKERRCEKLVNPRLIESYAQAFARFIQCEEAVSTYGLLGKHPTTGGAIASPFVSMSQNFQKQANLIWYEIFDIVKQNTTTAFISTPQDDMMERLLRKKKERD